MAPDLANQPPKLGTWLVTGTPVLLVAGAVLFCGRLVLYADNYPSFDVVVPVSSEVKRECLVAAERDAFGASHVRATESLGLTIEHAACLTSAQDRATHLTYGFGVSGGTAFLEVGSQWNPNLRLRPECVPALRHEMRRAVRAYLNACDPKLATSWTSTCHLGGPLLPDSRCPDIGRATDPE